MKITKKVIQELKNVEKNIRLPYHSFKRAKQRNVDTDFVKEKLRNLEIQSVRENPEKDSRFEKTYKVTIEKTEEEKYEMPIYFNPEGNEIYVKSVWIK